MYRPGQIKCEWGYKRPPRNNRFFSLTPVDPISRRLRLGPLATDPLDCWHEAKGQRSHV